MKKPLLIASVIVVLLAAAAFFYIGCGQSGSSSSSSSSSGNYTLSGSVGTVTSTGIGAKAATTVTHIVAIGADNQKTLITPEANGDFVATLNSGQPYVLGFYNKTGSTITLLGYLKNSDYDWDSLPIIDPTDSATDLGTVEINTASVEATPSINITSLIGEMNMTAANATLYGSIDDSLSALTNIDIDGNGVFDFAENKQYLFQAYIGMYVNGAPATGQINSMFGQYNSSYNPSPYHHAIYFSGQGTGDTKTVGTNTTLTAPAALGGSLTQTATTGSQSGAWTIFYPSVTTPEAAPSGTYTVAIGSTTYTINNFKASNIMAVGANNNIVFPIFQIVSTEATGKITAVKYKWRKLVNGTPQDATAAEVKASINYASGTTDYQTMNPFISFFSDQNTLIADSSGNKFFYLGLTEDQVDVSALNITRTNIDHLQAGYEFTSKVIVKFDLY